MKLKILLVGFLTLISLYSCTTFKGVKSKESINGTFNAFYNQKVFEGFFSISNNSLRLDIVNTFGFSVYGIYAQNNNVFLKDYQNGKIYDDITIDNENLSIYKPLIIYIMRHFNTICKHNDKKQILILSCTSIGDKILPSALILEDTNHKRLRINFYKMQIKTKAAVQ